MEHSLIYNGLLPRLPGKKKKRRTRSRSLLTNDFVQRISSHLARGGKEGRERVGRGGKKRE